MFCFVYCRFFVPLFSRFVLVIFSFIRVDVHFLQGSQGGLLGGHGDGEGVGHGGDLGGHGVGHSGDLGGHGEGGHGGWHGGEQGGD